MASTRKQLKMINFMGHRMRVDIKDGRQIIGQMLGFDKHMNLVLVDAEELRKTKRKVKGADGNFVETEEKRSLGMIILRGQEVVACVADGPPPADPSARLGNDKPNGTIPAASVTAPGISRPAGRGAGLQGPAAGVGGPAFGGFPPPGFPGAPPSFGGPPGFGRGFQPPGGPGFGFPGGPPGFQPQQFPPPGGRGFPPQGGFPGR